ncbi:MAG: 50S ribosomal protein L22 [Deltaproteobacteria bacterium]|nr:50S ribosomal protein L22 [Deltaproteobacteria bacterium]
MVEKKKSKPKKAAKGKSSKAKKSAAPKKRAAKKSAPRKQRAKKAAQEPVVVRVGKFEVVSSATLRNVRISPQKARLLIGLIKGKQVEPALQALRFSPRKGARFLEKLLKSAISNAVERASADVDKLWVAGGWVDKGRTLKRLIPRAQGRGDIIKKRSSHLTVQLGERR